MRDDKEGCKLLFRSILMVNDEWMNEYLTSKIIMFGVHTTQKNFISLNMRFLKKLG